MGTEYTDKLEGMFRDMELSDELTKHYNVRHRQADLTPQEKRLTPLGFDLSVNVLTQAYWPTYSAAIVQLPGEVSASSADD